MSDGRAGSATALGVMFTGQISIGKIVARCPSQTEPLMARLRLSHLLQSADIAPPGFPPQAILVIGRVWSPQNISLSKLYLRPDWEQEMREVIARLWRRAARPTRGVVPAGAEAVLFQDMGEWLACLGVAIQGRTVERHWCWRTPLRGNPAVSSSQTLAHAWAQAPRFIPAAVVHLGRWGEIARVLMVLQQADADTLLAALRTEFDLPQAALYRASALSPISGAAQRVAYSTRPTSVKDQTVSSTSEEGDRTKAIDVSVRRESAQESLLAAPWKRWISTVESACELMPSTAQHLLAMSVATFHAPAVARSRRFAVEVRAWIERASVTQAGGATTTPVSRAPIPGKQEKAEAAKSLLEISSASDTDPDERAAAKSVVDAAGEVSRFTRTARDTARAATLPTQRNTDKETKRAVTEEPAPTTKKVNAEVAPEGGPETDLAPWARLEGCETALGGVLFLLNVCAHLRLPECFDEDFHLSEHISGWGLAGLLGRVLLGRLHKKHADDPMWRMLAQLDGRQTGELPAMHLQVGDSYRIPARWLRSFAPDEMNWQVSASARRFVLWHETGDFIIVDRPRGRLALDELIAEEANYYRAQGVTAGIADRATALPKRVSYPFAALQRMALPCGLRRWMNWTFPFLRYALVRALDDGEVQTDEHLARVVLLKHGRLFCTATHVDLVMDMNQVSLPARAAGLDATPGWMRDLMRVVTFHYQ